MIKAVVFDCYGVLATDLWLEFKQRYFADKPELARQASELNHQSDLGLIDYGEFVERVSKMARVTPADSGLLEPTNVANKWLFDYIRENLKSKYKIGLLSNSSTDWLKQLFSNEQWQLFDAVVLSYDVGFIKPDPKIYGAIAEKLGVRLEECVFVDDRESYCDAARELGMKPVIYQNFEQAQKNLEAILKS